MKLIKSILAIAMLAGTIGISVSSANELATSCPYNGKDYPDGTYLYGPHLKCEHGSWVNF